MTTKAHITIQRGKGFVDRWRTYQVTVDGVVMATVRSGECVNVTVPAGPHALRLTSEWYYSGELQIEPRAGDHMIFQCGTDIKGWRLFRLFLKPWIPTMRSWIHTEEEDDEWLWLRRVA